MKSRTARFLLSALLAVLAAGAISASAATAATWRFDGTPLEGSEVTVGFGVESSLTGAFPLTTCEHFLYRMTIANNGGTGEGEVTEVPLFDCWSPMEECTIEAIEGEELPWSAQLAKVGESNYLVIEGVAISVFYVGEECPLDEVLLPVTGSAGGLFDNETEAATFDEASFEETETELEALGTSVQLEGVFPTEAFEWHREEPLSVS
jgi:hypothetical protein